MDAVDARSMQIEAIRCLLRNILLAVPYREFATFGMTTMVAVAMTYDQFQSLKRFAHGDQGECNGHLHLLPSAGCCRTLRLTRDVRQAYRGGRDRRPDRRPSPAGGRRKHPANCRALSANRPAGR